MANTKTSMPNRERFLGICRFERTGDISIIDWFHRALTETPDEWIKQGAPPEIRTAKTFNKHFQFDRLHCLDEIVSEHNRADLKKLGFQFHQITPPIVPVYPIKILREDERHRVETTYGGSTVEVNKQFPWRMPRFLDRPVKDRKTWQEYKKRLDPATPERWPADWADFVRKTNAEDAPVCLLLEGFFGILREWAGLEGLLYMFYDDTALVEDMMDTVLELDLGIARRVVKEIRLDTVRLWEDMAYRAGPLISPDMVKKYMVPRYKKVVDFLRGSGIDIIHIDSDGNVDELIPIWLDCGINFPWPFEVAAGMDAVALRKKYGKELIMAGNIDKRALLKGKDAIKTEIMSKVPFLVKDGGYFPSLDHGIPPDIPLENFRYYVNLLREIGGLPKLPE
jgi:uroporphyrinogen decarboxylase